MKKIILLLLLVLVSVTASARKSYITLTTCSSDGSANYESYTYGRFILTGDVPNYIEGFEYDGDRHYWTTIITTSNPNYKQYSTGEILNVLSEYGYEVEFVDNNNKSFILSKEIPDGQTVSEGDVNKDGEVNIADVNGLLSLILGIVRENPSILEQIKK